MNDETNPPIPPADQPIPTEGDLASSPAKGNPDSDMELLKMQLDQMTETCKRTLADFANYKRFVEDQRKQAAWFGISGMMSEILPIVDNFERALTHMSDLDAAHKEGIEAIYRQLTAMLDKHNVKKIETIGMPFNPLVHEVLTQAPGKENIIIEEFEKGYMIGDQVLKPAKVIVGNGMDVANT